MRNGVKKSIEDNGDGRAKAKELNKGKVRGPSLGLKITEERMKLFGNGSSHKSSINVTDLHDNNGQPSGIRVMVNLQLKIADESMNVHESSIKN